ncbi:protein MAIN-LIKE 2-like isoform X1 [Olea europaea var. sylvestris]|uniref:protein MAIN-LIKE 2-like isoform X1 n=1 Tax=Olea europaea var. sylvestris TaxID=158386 RepID=UPI000C1D244C|nr:protein MAIN-LIKE 2-like isoform X1 [Olea europaea var. sylvestris]XP_022848363.1 protein MAIN-LIKE 2-like isoform X1 [Olea europaea var. sylvestris]XP_022848364.1 protein MAIN-LIKE 2-like isoform X1 [Olea europaea var. sylvestris]
MNAGLGHTLHPGPIDDSVLTLQDHHRSTAIWNGQDFEPLTCRRCDGHFWRLGALDPQVQQLMLQAGFYGVYKAGRIRLDHALITALVERWRPETHTFHLPVGEATVTLQDISVLWGLPVDGDPITGVDTNRSMEEWQDICNELLGFKPPPEDFDRGRLKIRCLQERFKTLPEGASKDTMQFYARAYILQLLGGQLLSDMSNNKVKLMYLPLLRDFEAAGRLSWGSAVLSCLYRALCRATKPETSDICGPLVLLQIWAWERVPFIRPGRLAPRQQPPPDVVAGQHPLPAAPYGSRWNVGFKLESVGTHVLVLYRDQLDNMKDDQFVWEPYPNDVLGSLPQYCISGKRIWQTVSPLICFDVVEFHHPDRVLRQFGQQQTIPAICDTIPDIHLTDRRGRQNYDWAHHHRQFVDMWIDRSARIISTPPIDGPMDQSDPYMMWYRRITRLLIGNPATRSNTGYQGVGGVMESMAQSLQRIYHRASDAMYQSHEVSGHDVLREIQDICAYSLRAAHEDHRLTVRPDANLTAASPTILPKVQRGRPKKRGGFGGGSASESRKRLSHLPSTPSTSMAEYHSPSQSNVLPAHSELPDTPQTWDSSLNSSDYHDTMDPNMMQLNSEFTAPDSLKQEATSLSLDFAENPILQALGKIHDICAFALRMTNGNQSSPSAQTAIPVDPKTKRCKPRRRGGISGRPVGAGSGLGSYFPSTLGPSSLTPSSSLGPNTSRPHEILDQDFEPFATSLMGDSPLPELQDTMQSEMIELDAITGSREASPSAANLSTSEPPFYPQGDQSSVPHLTNMTPNFLREDTAPVPVNSSHTAQVDVRQVENADEGIEVSPPTPDPPVLEPQHVQTPQQSDPKPEMLDDTPSTTQGDSVVSQPSPGEHKMSPVHSDSDKVAIQVDGPGTYSKPDPPVLKPHCTETPVPSDSTNPANKDVSVPTLQGDLSIPKPSSPKHPISSVRSGAEAMQVDTPDTDSVQGDGGKRKERPSDHVTSVDSSHTNDAVLISGDLVNVNSDGKSLAKPLNEGEAKLTQADPASVTEDGQKKYKRQRRVPSKLR